MRNSDIKDYYYILGLNRNASKDEIKMAYRKLSVKFHPDKNNGDKFFEERFKDIQEAYETLSDDMRRKIYDDELSMGGATYSTFADKTTPKPPPPKKRLREVLLGIIGLLIVLSPFLKGAINRLNKKDNSETYNLLRYDTANNRVIDSKGTSITIHSDTDTATRTSDASSPTAGEGSLNTTSSDENTQTLNFKDDDGLTAQDVVKYFLNALNNSDCNTAWNMMYKTDWVNAGKDWFCSNQAFGTVKKVSVQNIYIASQYETVAEIHADYYAEDSYNGNKCFKQNITVQKLAYSDNKSRWKITNMKNTETPVECYGN